MKNLSDLIDYLVWSKVNGQVCGQLSYTVWNGTYYPLWAGVEWQIWYSTRNPIRNQLKEEIER
jgi:hypothetical protein